MSSGAWNGALVSVAGAAGAASPLFGGDIWNAGATVTVVLVFLRYMRLRDRDLARLLLQRGTSGEHGPVPNPPRGRGDE